MTFFIIIFLLTAFILAVTSYGFIDPNLTLGTNPGYAAMQEGLSFVVYRKPFIAASGYVGLLSVLYLLYGWFLRMGKPPKPARVAKFFLAGVVLLLFSYPALSYDLFNYIATAKVTFLYRENPYLVMPIEIPNEPMLAYTRAANKVALYGPVWILLTGIPHFLGMGNILATIFMFKALAAVAYLLIVFLIWKITSDIRQTAFFALNPLVIVETLVSGHNDAVMMLPALGGLFLLQKRRARERLFGWFLLISSVFIKGATLVLLPLMLLSKLSIEKFAVYAYWLLFGVFLLSPLREEMYPWYGIWWLTFAALVPMKKHSFIHGFSFWLSLGLMLRYVPWIATREYGGITPIVRIIFTIIPPSLYLVNMLHRKLLTPMRPHLS